MAPSVTETLFTIGAGDRVVGVTAYCNWPTEVTELPKVGEFAHFSFERILRLKPDLVIASRDAPNETIVYELNRYNIPITTVQAGTIDQAVETILDIGRAVGNEREAKTLAGEMKRRLRNISGIVKNAPKIKTIIVYDHEPLILGGPGTFADDIIRLAGGVNVAADAYVQYPRYSVERLVIEGPDVIIEAAHGGGYGDFDTEKITSFWDKWPSIPAVKNKQIAVVNSDIVSRPGPRIIDGLEAVARALHPELFQAGEGRP